MDHFYTNSTEVCINNTALKCTDHFAGAVYWIVMESVTAVLGLPANVMVLWILLRKQNSSEVFVMSMAVMDIMFCLNAPLEICNYFFLENQIVYPVAICVYYFNVVGSPLFLCVICVERYVAVVHPFTYLRFNSLTYRLVLTTVTWAITVALSAYLGKMLFEIPVYLISGFISVLLIIMVFCNVSILRSLKRSGPGRDDIHPMKKKAFNIVFTIFMILLVSYFPAAAIFPFKLYFNDITFECYLVPVALSCFIPSACIQPLLYLYNLGILTRDQFPCSGVCCAGLDPSP